jgi:hypothetical protein
MDPTKPSLSVNTPTATGARHPPNAPRRTRRTRDLSQETLWPLSLSSLRARGLVDDSTGSYLLEEDIDSREASHSRQSSLSSISTPSVPTITPETSISPIITATSRPSMAAPGNDMNNVDLTNLVNLLSQHLQQNPGLAATLQGGRPVGAPATIEHRWRLEEVGIFEPDLPIDDRNPSGDAVTVGRDTIYRNVDAFCERIADAIASKGSITVRDNLQSCLRGQALRWYTHELAATDKTFIRNDLSPNLDHWIIRLRDRFRPRLAQAVRENSELMFRIGDIRAGRRVSEYFQSNVLRARAAGFESTHAQLVQVYLGLDTPLHRDLYEPTADTTIQQYRLALSEKEEVWIESYLPRNGFPPSPRGYGMRAPSPQLPYRSRTPSPQMPYRQQQQIPFPNQPFQGYNWRSPQNRPPLSSYYPPQRNQSQQPQSQRSQYPCPFHLARGETYNHSALNCYLPDAAAWRNRQNTPNQPSRFPQQNQAIMQGQSPAGPTPRVEIINHGDMGPSPETPHPYDYNREFYDAEGELAFDGYSQNSFDDGSQMELNDVDSYSKSHGGEGSDDNHRDHSTAYHMQPRPSFPCGVCRAAFSSRNKLFKHIRLLGHQKKPPVSHGQIVTNMFANMGSTPEIICSDAPKVKGDGLAFRDYNYLELAMRTSPDAPDKSVCGDTGCGMSCVDREFFAQEYPDIQPSQVPPIEIRGLGGKMTVSSEYVVLPVYFPGYKPGTRIKALAKVEKEFHVVDNLSCNALIGNDILQPEKMSIDLENQQIRIGSCGGLLCPVRIVPRDKPIRNRLVRTTTQSYLKRHAKTLIPVRIKGLPDDRDFRFTAQYNASSSYLAVCGHFPEAVLDSKSQFVAYYNNSDTDLMLPPNTPIGNVCEWDLNETATKENPDVINCHFAVPGIIPSLKFAAKIGLTALQCAQALRPGQIFYPKPDVMLGKELQADSYSLLPQHIQVPINSNSLLPNIEIKTEQNSSTSSKSHDGMDIFSLLPPLEPMEDMPSKFGAEAVNINTTDEITSEQIETLRNVLADFPTLWEDRIGRVIEPEEDWMEIPLKDGAVVESKGRYKVSKRDEAAIDEIFDWAIQDGRMSPVHGVIPAGWPVFVVWNKGKARPVVDLRGLNKLVVRDSYPLPYQDAILEPIAGKRCISIVDLQKAYYQRFIRKHERWKTTVITHRGQEQFNVVPMGYAGSPSHMQKFMDKVLKPHWEYARCYIDDIVIFSDDFESHIRHLRAVLATLSELGMTLSPDKCCIGYHSVQLLGHVVDRYGLSTLPEKVSAIASMQFPKHLKELELFIGLSGYYRHFIARYAALIEPLQKRKTTMLRGVSRRGKDRSSHARKIENPSQLEITSFQIIKDALCSPNILVHHDQKLPLLVYVDSSVEGGFAAAVHQVPKEEMDKKNLSVEDILHGRHDRKLEHPVTYLSRMLNKHEVNYWPTELEIAGIVWTMQKIRHLIEGPSPTKVFTDHEGAEDIMDMTTLKTKSAVRQNLRLIRASQFVSQYPSVRVVYRRGKDNVNADALSRLIHLRSQQHPDNDVEGVYGFTVTVVGLSMSTLRQLKQGYTKDRHLSLIYDEVKARFKKKDEVLQRQIPDDEVLPNDIFEELDKYAPETIQYQGFQGRLCYNHLLLYILDLLDGHPRLCIPANSHKLFFEAAHDHSSHAGFEKAYKKLRPNYYIKNLASSLRAYIRSCPACQVNNTLRHKPYGLLQPIASPATPFEMVTLWLLSCLVRLTRMHNTTRS